MNVTFIIPAYNAADTLEETLESLLAQTMPSWEAIVVDDGSIDRTGQIADAFSARDARIRVIHQANGGMTVARNNALPETSFDWVCFLDSDDWLLPAYLERMTSALESDPNLDAVHCGWHNVDPHGTKFEEHSNMEAGDLFPALARRNIFPIHTCIVRRSLVQSVGGFDTSVGVSADWDLWQRIARAGARFAAIPDILAVYRLRPRATWLNAEKYLVQGIGIIDQGHSPDPRVSSAVAAHRNGLPTGDLPRSLYAFVCWPAAFALGRGDDARPLLHALDRWKCPELEPEAVAKAIYYGALLPLCKRPDVWENLWPGVEQNVDLFLAELERQSGAKGLARRTRAILERMIGVAHAGRAASGLRRIRKRIGRMLGLPTFNLSPRIALRPARALERASGIGRVLRGDRRGSGGRALVLMYHRVNEIRPDPWDLCVSPGHFGEHLEVLKALARPLSLTGLLEYLDKGRVPDRSVVVTFDDGYADNFTQACPLLERYRIPATFFLASGLIGSHSEFWWDELEQIFFRPGALPETLRLEFGGATREWEFTPDSLWNPRQSEIHRDWKYYKPLPGKRHQVFCEVKEFLKRMPGDHRLDLMAMIRNWAGVRTEVRPTHRVLSSQEVIELARAGLNEIGSHTATHPILSAIPIEIQREEIAQSKSALEALLNRPVTNFAFPYGGPDTYSGETVHAVRETGYRSACTTSDGFVHKHSGAFKLPRVMVRDWDGRSFAQNLSRWFGERDGPTL